MKQRAKPAVLHAATAYDVPVWLIAFGRERASREKMLRLAHLELGESVLDVGCGTGSLAIAAKRQVGTTGTVYGVDAYPEMIARAAEEGEISRRQSRFQTSVRPVVAFSRQSV